MLIPSPRHRPEDLLLWADYEEADAIRARSATLAGRVARSLSVLREFVGRGDCYASVSWGKDSVVTADLMRRVSLHPPLVNLACTNRNPDCNAVRDAYLSVSRQHYFEINVDYGDLHSSELSEAQLDKATDAVWYRAIDGASKQFGRHVLGIRADESGIRRMRCRVWGESSPNACSPLAWWTQEDVFAYLYARGLPVHPAYAMLGGGRWPRDRIRTAEIGDTHGRGGGRRQWEAEYYGDILRRLESGDRKKS